MTYKAKKVLRQYAILSGSAGALFSGKIDGIVNSLQTISDASKEVEKNFVTNALNQEVITGISKTKRFDAFAIPTEIW